MTNRINYGFVTHTELIMLPAMQVTDPIARGAELLARGDLAGAQAVAEAILAQNQAEPDALHLLALLRIRQQRMNEALALLQRSLTARPGHAHVQFNLGKLLVLAGRDRDGVAALEGAVAADPRLAEAWLELGDARARLGDAEGAEADYRKTLALEPKNPFALMALGAAVKDQGRAAEAETILAGGMVGAREAPLKAGFAYNLGLAQYDLGKKEMALANFSLVAALEPSRSSVQITRADLLQELSRYDEAESTLRKLIAREPLNEAAHAALNDLIYRMGRQEEFLKSYDRAPHSTGLQLGKANLLFKTGKALEAHAIHDAVLAREPGQRDAAIGGALCLNQLGRHSEALALLETALARTPDYAPLYHHLAASALQAGDPQKAAAAAQQGLKLAPDDYYGLAVLGSAWRAMGDERDEALNGYDELVRVFDLPAPPGFSSMAAFNAELNAWLGGLHDTVREPIEQSLRGGSQTSGNIFNEGHPLIEKLKSRISEAMKDYIAGIRPQASHPFRGRAGRDFRFTGSWSSRLKDCGYHINHIHPQGWISSCYYVAVPEAAKDENAKQGWIKFGEPGFEAGLKPRRALQPLPGRLVLFPSYMWHGTIAFHDPAARTTIAFDAVPK